MKMINLFRSSVLCLGVAANCASAQDEYFPRTQRYLESQVSEGIPGLAYAITLDQEVVAEAGLGVVNTDTREPVTTDTLFHIGSTHKSMTAFVIARLVEQGKVTWSTSVQDILTQSSFSDAAVERVTLDQLISMTSGVTADSDDDFYDQFGDLGTPAQVIQFIQSYRLPLFPNEEYSYSNLSASLAGYLAVYAAGEDTADLNRGYSNLLSAALLAPLGMSNSTIFVSEARATGKMSSSHTPQGTLAVSEDRDDDMYAPAGSLKAPVTDMARYVMTMARSGVAPDGLQVLSQRSVRQLWRPSRVSRRSGDNYGRGWEKRRVARELIVMHEGAFDNFTSVIAVSPRNRAGLVVLANTERTGDLYSRVLRFFARELRRAKRQRAKR